MSRCGRSNLRWPGACSRALAVFLAALLCVPGYSMAEPIYRCRDAAGNVTFTNRKPSDQQCEIFRESSFSSAEREEPAPAAPPAALRLPIGEGAAANYLHGQGLAFFYEKLKALQEGKSSQVTIFHVGDSHVSSETFARTIAAGLQSEFGAMGGSFCLPVEKPVKKKKGKSPAAKPQTQAPAVKVARRPIFPVKPVSATLAGEGNRCYTITSVPMSPESEGIRYFSYGVVGKTFSWYAQQPVLEFQLKNYKPDIVIVTLGTNDAFGKPTYEAAWQSIDRFVSTVRAVTPESAILLMSPPDCFLRSGRVNRDAAVVQRAIIEYADQHGLTAWDLYTAMGGAGSMDSWLAANLARPDRVHFSSDGYALIGEMFLSAVLEGYQQYATSTETGGA